MFTISRIETYQQEIKKSRFIAIAAPVASEQAAKEFLTSHSDLTANHNCWAWRMGQNYRFNDDGEPSGTAGKPILQAIDGQQLDNIVVVVTRWFGGILLGSGGLMRAYGGSAATCLRLAEKTELIPQVGFWLACSFSEHPIMKARLSAIENVVIADESFTASGVELSGLVPISDRQKIASMVEDLTRGKSAIKYDE